MMTGAAPYPPQGPPPHRRGRMVAVAVIVVVVLLVLGGLFALGAFSPKNSSSGPATYNQASSATSNYMSSYKGGGWRTLFATGLVSRLSVASPATNISSFANLSALPGCTLTSLLAPGAVLTLPGDSAPISSGKASGWIFADINSTGTLAAVEDLSGTIAVDYIVNCGLLGAELSILPGIPSDVIDSSTAMSDLLAQGGGSAFVAAHTNLTADYSIGFSGSSILGSDSWSISIQACTLSTTSSSTSVPTYSGTVGAVNGTVTGAGESNQTCGSTSTSSGSTASTLDSQLSLGSVATSTTSTNATGGAGVCSVQQPCLTYSIPVMSAGSGLTWGDVGLEVLGAGGFPLVGAANWTWDIQSVGGTNVASDYGGLETGWTGTGSSGRVTAGELIVLTVPASASLSGAGDRIQAFGTGAYTGSVDAAVP